MATRKFTVTIAIAAALTLPIAAQNLSVPGADTSAEASVAFPQRGMSMNQVEKSYGAPTARRAAVGDPPITRWEYGSFVVYFEYKHVIHSVPKR
ncbi:MAG: hypothetical protein AB8G17_06735 [Gammaproteobacteria bacterium]